MSTPTPGSDPNYPQGGAPQGQPGWGAPPPPDYGNQPQGYGSPAPSYSNAPSSYGPGNASAGRPGLVTAAAIVGIVWGGLGTLFGLLALSVAFALSGLLGIIVLVALVLAVALLVGGIFILMGRDPKLLLYTAYVAIVINVIELIISIAQNGGSAFNGILGFILPGVIVALLFQPPSKQYFAARGFKY
jgi:hypothetical protein